MSGVSELVCMGAVPVSLAVAESRSPHCRLLFLVVRCPVCMLASLHPSAKLGRSPAAVAPGCSRS
jgi:hypothetical protein